MKVSEVYYPARFGEEYYPVKEERRQAEGGSMVCFNEVEHQSSDPVYKVVRMVSDLRATTRSSSGICPYPTSVEKTLKERTSEERRMELFEPVSPEYHTARTKHEGSCYSEEPLTDPELRTKKRRMLNFGTEDSEDENVSEVQHCQTRKTNRCKSELDSTFAEEFG